jgi:hypothetical protein
LAGLEEGCGVTTIPIRLAVTLIVASWPLFMIVEDVVAQENPWSFFVTTQAWISHIAKNGLAPASTIAGAEPIVDRSATIVRSPFAVENSQPVNSLDPQWGLQVLALRDRLTLGGAFQYVAFETRNDLFYKSSNTGPHCYVSSCITPGARVAQEFLDTTRIDMDFAASYYFPDVVPTRMDASIGGGLKLIYASASRGYGNLSPYAAAFASVPPPGLYKVCRRDDCADVTFRERAKTTSWIY